MGKLQSSVNQALTSVGAVKKIGEHMKKQDEQIALQKETINKLEPTKQEIQAAEEFESQIEADKAKQMKHLGVVVNEPEESGKFMSDWSDHGLHVGGFGKGAISREEAEKLFYELSWGKPNPSPSQGVDSGQNKEPVNDSQQASDPLPPGYIGQFLPPKPSVFEPASIYSTRPRIDQYQIEWLRKQDMFSPEAWAEFDKEEKLRFQENLDTISRAHNWTEGSETSLISQSVDPQRARQSASRGTRLSTEAGRAKASQKNSFRNRITFYKGGKK